MGCFYLALDDAHKRTRSEFTMALTVCIGFLGIAVIGGYILDTRDARVVASAALIIAIILPLLAAPSKAGKGTLKA